MSAGARFGSPGRSRSTISSKGAAVKTSAFDSIAPPAMTTRVRKFAPDRSMSSRSSRKASSTASDPASRTRRSASSPPSRASARRVASVPGRAWTWNASTIRRKNPSARRGSWSWAALYARHAG